MIKSKLKKSLKRIIKRYTNLYQGENIRKDLIKIEIDGNLEFLVYWKILSIGKGPAVVLSALGQELLKFDCFGENRGHYHVMPTYSQRIFFYENTRMSQIQRTIKELRHNTVKYLKIHPKESIRKLTINQKLLERGLLKVEHLLIQYESKFTED
ncbi:MAG: hypothetical protein ABJH98_09285 [Reichenbachiella sp.]|uniref:DUF7700 domain-containing protein n=1 Tax=Reichenbachiella sp. TaxID=2184521 RepID=UPI003298E989